MVHLYDDEKNDKLTDSEIFREVNCTLKVRAAIVLFPGLDFI